MGKPEDAKKYPQSSPKYWWTTLDFEKQEVRDYLLRITEEVCRLYDVDGIEIDYFRYPMFFRPNLDFEPATQKQLDILTEFQRSIMQMSVREGAKRGRPILVATRVPASVTACRNVGIDVERWLREGLLDIMPLGNGGAWPNVPVEEITTGSAWVAPVIETALVMSRVSPLSTKNASSMSENARECSFSTYRTVDPLIVRLMTK